MAGEIHQIPQFKAFCGWISRFTRHTGTQSSLEPYRKGGTEHPSGQEERMDKIREITSDYSFDNNYNGDESGLFYLMEPNKTYFYREETR